MNQAEAHFNRAAELHSQGDWDGAIAEYREGLRFLLDDPLAHVNIGNAMLRKGDFDGAVLEYSEAVRLDPNHPLSSAQ